MKDIRIYCDPEDMWVLCGYDDILNSFEFEIELKVDEENYQGDSYVIFKDEKRIGFLIFGWGSCSGCDALLACETIEEVKELQKELFSAIKWFNNKTECLNYFNTHDFKCDFCWHNDEFHKFYKEAINYLEK